MKKLVLGLVILLFGFILFLVQFRNPLVVLNNVNVDSEYTDSNPGGYVEYIFSHTNFNKIETYFNWKVLHKNNPVGIYPSLMHFWFQAGQGGYTGPQYEIWSDGKKVKKAIFTIWDYSINTAYNMSDECFVVVQGLEGNHVTCIIHNDASGTSRGKYYPNLWGENKSYKIEVVSSLLTNNATLWTANLVDISDGQKWVIGKIKLNSVKNYSGYGLITSTGGFFEYYWGNKNDCMNAEYGEFFRRGTFAYTESGRWLPKKANAINNLCIRALRSSSGVGMVYEYVGNGAKRMDNINTLWENSIDFYSPVSGDGICDISQNENCSNEIGDCGICSPSVCVPNWNCSVWSSCSNNLKTRSCSDLNNCNNLTGKPATSQSCYNSIYLSLDNHIKDSSGNAITSSSGIQYVLGIRNNGTYFNKNASVSMNTSIDLTKDLSFSLWMKPGNISGRQNLLCKAYSGEGCITFEPAGYFNFYDGDLSKSDSFSSLNLSKPVAIKEGNWYYIVVTRNMNSGEVSWYINGELITTREMTFKNISKSNLLITVGNGYAGGFNGTIDEIKIFTKVLSLNEVKEMFNI